MKALLTIAPLVLLVVACTEGHPPAQTPSLDQGAAPPPRTCPLGVANAHVAYEDVEGGAALTFTAMPEQLTDLRERAQYASASHGPEKLGKGHDGTHANGGEHGLKLMQMPVARAGERDIPGGARIVFTPADPSELEVLRSRLRARAVDLMAGCR